MGEIEETVLLGWARDAGGGQRFTGGGIDDRMGLWCMDRLRRGTPTVTVSTYALAEAMRGLERATGA